MDPNKLLKEQDYQNAATLLNVPVASIKAIAEVESRGNGFFDNDKPKILFEAAVFGKYTKYKYNQTHPNLSSKKWNKALYFGGMKEYDRLNAAVQLNEQAALLSTSWGKFQIMGFNHKICGYSDVFSFVNDQYLSEGIHLMCFVKFVKGNNLDIFIRNKDWAGFAYRYNGPGYAKNAYDVKIAKSYKKFGGV
jgi:hypothetical protein